MKKKIGAMTLLLLLLSACGNAATATAPVDEVSTIVAGTMQALTATAPTLELPPTQISGTNVLLNGIAFVIPPGIATGALAEPQEAVPPTENVPWWEIHPAYVEYPLQGYVLSNTFHAPKVYVYPVNEFIQVNADVAAGIDQLKTILSSPTQPLPENLPFLPTFNAAQVFYSNEQLITFQNGSGIRYLTQFDQAPAPVNNHAVFYTFQGITSDGQYYVSAILPVSIGFLAEYASPEYPVPADGIPFDWDKYENIQAHFDGVKQKLNGTDPSTFNPSLLTLDEMIQSISITGNP
ncbi:MAG: hypothetical protein H7Y59_06575 [Anaerolineales bacterium]|nr:hypothetical protein [Anaerolineales bacterium]